jgi:amidophosphoribosyltransferase
MQKHEQSLNLDLYPERDDKPREECGVVGVLSPNGGAVEQTFFALQALQDRGQEAAGISMRINGGIVVQKDTGLVRDVFGKHGEMLGGNQLVDAATGQVRYSTTDGDPFPSSQPFLCHNNLSLSHNGEIVNPLEIAQIYNIDPMGKTDTQIAAEAIGRQGMSGKYNSTEEMLLDTLPNIKGAFSMVLMEGLEDTTRLIAIRDGIRPLSVGQLPNGGYIAASETSALDIVGATFDHDVEAGTFEVITFDGIEKIVWTNIKNPLCAMEHVYFADPSSKLEGVLAHSSRIKAGRELGRQHPVEADLVIPVPDSGRSAAHGFARELGIPLEEGLTKRRHIARTFIEPTQALRKQGLRLKFNPMPEIIEGQRLVVVDDSIVRGNTTRQIVQMLRDAGAAEVHMRVSSPEHKNPCFYGQDTSNPDELVARHMTVEEMRIEFGLDSLGFLSIDGLHRSIGRSVCDACFTGKYPVPVEGFADSLALSPS